jgi:hypothetical protein
MKNSEVLNQIIEKLEENHINLYHDISKSEVADYISKIKNLDDMSDLQFDYELLKLFALFKDAHTCYFIKNFISLDHRITFIDKKFYVLCDDVWQEISAFGDMSSEQFYNKMREIISFETDAWLNECIREKSNNGYYFLMLGLMDEKKELKISLANGKSIMLAVDNNIHSKHKKSTYYYKIMNENILYVRYKKCIENPYYKFADFVKDITKELDDKNIHHYILDVRNNTGGSDTILNPFQNLVAERHLYGAMIINNGVFSAVRFALARFKKEFNILLVGEPTGLAAKSYGYKKDLEVDGKHFTASTKLFDLSDIFGYYGSVQPDVYIPLTIEDMQNDHDRQLEWALEYLSQKIVNKGLSK